MNRSIFLFEIILRRNIYLAGMDRIGIEYGSFIFIWKELFALHLVVLKIQQHPCGHVESIFYSRESPLRIWNTQRLPPLLYSRDPINIIHRLSTNWTFPLINRDAFLDGLWIIEDSLDHRSSSQSSSMLEFKYEGLLFSCNEAFRPFNI